LARLSQPVFVFDGRGGILAAPAARESLRFIAQLPPEPRPGGACQEITTLTRVNILAAGTCTAAAKGHVYARGWCLKGRSNEFLS
jgi:hypothetical protein